MTNPSFNFTWDINKKNIKSKVFARKRPQKSNNSNRSNEHVNAQKQDNVKSVTENIETTNHVDNTQHQECSVVQNAVDDEGTPSLQRNKPKKSFLASNKKQWRKVDTENFIPASDKQQNVHKPSKTFSRKLPQKNKHEKQTERVLVKKKNDVTVATENKEETDDEIDDTQFQESGDEEDSVDYGQSTNSFKRNKSSFASNEKEWDGVVTGKSVTEKLFASNKSFGDIQDVHKHIVSNLEKHNFMRLTTVQEKAIPVINDGKNTLVSYNQI